MKFKFTLKSISPLLLHADDVELSDQVKAWRVAPDNKQISVPGDDRSPPWTWMTYCYTNGTHITVPSDNLSACLLKAGAQVILKGQKTFKEATQCGLFIVHDHMPVLVDGKPIQVADINALRDFAFAKQAASVKDLGFTLFVKRAKVGAAKHVRVRARFEKWSLNGEVHVLAKEITEGHLKQIFDIAGFYKGLCDWRPGSPKSPGRFGRFEVSLEKLD